MRRLIAPALLAASLLSAQQSPPAASAQTPVPAPLASPGPQPFDVNTLLSLVRLSDPQISPDGKTVAFVAQSVDLAANKKQNSIYTVPLAGGEPRKLGDGDRPRWMPDSLRLIFDSDRSGQPQIWAMNADGSSAKQLTSFATDAANVTLASDAKHFLFVSDVFPECGADDACNKRALDAAKLAPTARVIDSLLYRHWTTWEGARRSHIFSAALDPVLLNANAIHDLTSGQARCAPVFAGRPRRLRLLAG